MVDAAGYEKPSTAQAVKGLEGWKAKRPTLVLVGPDEDTVGKSFRNIPRVSVMEATAAGVADVIGAASLVISEAALKTLSERAK